MFGAPKHDLVENLGGLICLVPGRGRSDQVNDTVGRTKVKATFTPICNTRCTQIPCPWPEAAESWRRAARADRFLWGKTGAKFSAEVRSKAFFTQRLAVDFSVRTSQAGRTIQRDMIACKAFFRFPEHGRHSACFPGVAPDRPGFRGTSARSQISDAARGSARDS